MMIRWDYWVDSGRHCFECPAANLLHQDGVLLHPYFNHYDLHHYGCYFRNRYVYSCCLNSASRTRLQSLLLDNLITRERDGRWTEKLPLLIHLHVKSEDKFLLDVHNPLIKSVQLPLIVSFSRTARSSGASWRRDLSFPTNHFRPFKKSEADDNCVVLV